MKAQELKHMALLEEWKGRVSECRSSGQGVRRWCREQGIAATTYYHWEKEVLSAAEAEMGRVRKASETEERFAAAPALAETTAIEGEAKLAARLRMKGRELEVYAGADEQVLERLLRVMKDAE